MFPVIAILMIILFPVLIPLTVSAGHHVDYLRKRTSFRTTMVRQRPARRVA
jgi:hypothetical protein